MAALNSTSYNTLNPFLQKSNYSKQHPKYIQNVLIPPSLSPNLTLIRTSNRKSWKKKAYLVMDDQDYGGIRRRRCVDVVKCRQMSGSDVPESEVEENDEGKNRKMVLFLVVVGMCLCSANGIAALAWLHPDVPSLSPNLVYNIQRTFQWVYIVFSVMIGAMTDKFGGARAMGLVLGLWFLATFMTPWLAFMWHLVDVFDNPFGGMIRSLLKVFTPWANDFSITTILVLPTIYGLAQGLLFPSMNLLLSRWFTTEERGRAVGIALAGLQLGNILGFQQEISTIGPFVFFPLGLTWLVSWVCGVNHNRNVLQLRQSNKDHFVDSCHMNGLNLQSFPLLMLNKPFWAILLANFTYNWGFFVLSWIPIYFRIVLNVKLNQNPWFDMIPWGVMAITSYIAGWICDYLTKSGYSLLFVHRLMQDIAPYSIGLIHGITNIVGTYGATICLFGATKFVKLLGSYETFLTLTSMLYFATIIFYNFCATTERII
ncbi:unnamed protein product [Amaranthus hypochondriacus]